MEVSYLSVTQCTRLLIVLVVDNDGYYLLLLLLFFVNGDNDEDDEAFGICEVGSVVELGIKKGCFV